MADFQFSDVRSPLSNPWTAPWSYISCLFQISSNKYLDKRVRFDYKRVLLLEQITRSTKRVKRSIYVGVAFLGFPGRGIWWMSVWRRSYLRRLAMKKEIDLCWVSRQGGFIPCVTEWVTFLFRISVWGNLYCLHRANYRSYNT